jgi:hypothetical protein
MEARLLVSLPRNATRKVTVSYRTVNDTAMGSAPSVFFIRPDRCKGHQPASPADARPAGPETLLRR